MAASMFRSRRALVIENLALRHQFQVLRRTGKRPRFRPLDRSFWVLLSRLWTDWRGSLVLVKPETVIGWHRKGFRLYWRGKSGKPGRPRIPKEVRDLIRRISTENPTWGAPRIHAEPMASVDFFTVPTATFRILYVLVILSHARRRIVHFNVTESRTHPGLGKDCPEPRSLEPPKMGKIVAIPQVGRLHHRYTHIAA